jgi:hypothetical protein
MVVKLKSKGVSLWGGSLTPKKLVLPRNKGLIKKM